MFRCPQCRVPLERQTAPGLGVFWRCRECGGRMASFGFLRKAVERTSVDGLWNNAREKKTRDGRPCPSCDGKMIETEVPSRRAEEAVDVCPSCQFVWFDAKEYEALPESREADGLHKAQPEISEEDRPEIGRARIAALAEQRAEHLEVGAPNEEPEDWLGSLLHLPIHEERHELSRVPFVTIIVAAVIAVASIAGWTVDGGTLIDKLGLVPARWEENYGLTLLSSFFLHADIEHLVGNLLFFIIVGPNAEDVLGRARFVTLLFLSAFVGDVAHIFTDPASMVPCIGASGGISGVLAFFALRFPLAKPHFLLQGLLTRKLPMIVWFLFWAAYQMPILYWQVRGDSDVSAAAHLGGVVVGVLFWLRYRKS